MPPAGYPAFLQYLQSGRVSQFYIQQIQQVGTTNLYDVLTNLALGDSALYGYNFTRWVLRLGYVGPVPTGTPMPVNQTFDIVTDDYNNILGSAVADGVHRVFRISARTVPPT